MESTNFLTISILEVKPFKTDEQRKTFFKEMENLFSSNPSITLEEVKGKYREYMIIEEVIEDKNLNE